MKPLGKLALRLRGRGTLDPPAPHLPLPLASSFADTCGMGGAPDSLASRWRVELAVGEAPEPWGGSCSIPPTPPQSQLIISIAVGEAPDSLANCWRVELAVSANAAGSRPVSPRTGIPSRCPKKRRPHLSTRNIAHGAPEGRMSGLRQPSSPSLPAPTPTPRHEPRQCFPMSGHALVTSMLADGIARACASCLASCSPPSRWH